MRIGYVSLQGRGATDACIAAVVAELRSAGARLAGTVQTNFDRAKSHPCDMDLMVLPAGPVLRISQDLGPGASGCRLNGGVLEDAVMQAARHLARADLLVVNKFGKLEAEGRGFVPLIAEAMEREIPVIVGVNGLNLPAFLRFTDGTAKQLTCAPAEIAKWLSGQPAL
ncbi:MAG: 3-dehydroquinate dehydratase [Rhodobacter sp.]|nr:3-dehydroquinate dehydratase [Rhodobacter sp.]